MERKKFIKIDKFDFKKFQVSCLLHLENFIQIDCKLYVLIFMLTEHYITSDTERSSVDHNMTSTVVSHLCNHS